jgi:hypothetical protein
MVRQDIHPSSSRAVLNIRAHHTSVPDGTVGNKCLNVIFAASKDRAHHVVCDVCDVKHHRHMDTHKTFDYIGLMRPCRYDTDTKRSLSAPANFPFRLAEEIYCHIRDIINGNGNTARPRLVDMDRVDALELIESLTQLSLRPQN